MKYENNEVCIYAKCMNNSPHATKCKFIIEDGTDNVLDP